MFSKLKKLTSCILAALLITAVLIPSSTGSAAEATGSVQASTSDETLQLKEAKARVSVHDPSSLKTVTRITCSVLILRRPSQPI